MISQRTIEKIFDTARIEEVIGDFVQLKRSGSSLKGLSPFSSEKTPSFMVSPAKQIFKDFSSGKGGTVVSFLMEHEHYSYPEALRYLARRYNIEVEETGQSEAEKAERNQRESLFLVNEFANDYFQKQLWESDSGRRIGLSYFKERGLTEESIRHFQLGYSQDDYEAFTQTALRENYQLDYLAEVGLTKVDGQRKTDRFRGRVMFPILSHTGRVLGFGGRTLKKEAKIAKYLNSPESEIYQKSKILYGLFQAKTAIGREGECFLVEGYTDVISLYQNGVENVVASSGTALTRDQIALIKRYTPRVTLLFDGDPAGIKASLRGIDLLLEMGMEVEVVLFPEGEDPDSYAQRVSPPELKSYLSEEKTNFLRFKARLLLEESGDNPLEKSRAAREMVKSIALIPGELERNAYVQETARILDIEERVLFSELGQMLSARQEQESRDKERQKQREERQQGENMAVVDRETAPATDSELQPLYHQERALCWLLVNYGDQEFEFAPRASQEEEEPFTEPLAVYILTELATDQLEFSNPHFRAILETFTAEYNERERIATEQDFLRGENEELTKIVVDLITQNHRLHDWSKKKIYLPEREESVARYATEAILRFKEKKISLLIHEIQNTFRGPETPEEGSLETLKRLNQLRVEINKELHRVV